MGGRLGISPVLLLTTTGRKTGKQHTIPLLYLNDGDNLILVASNGGAPIHPVWWLNLQANPEAVVEIGKIKLPMRARQADAEEHKRLWPLLVAMYADFAEYQKRLLVRFRLLF
jgi:F420H(2)-dependent quinone reductase